MPLGKRTDCGDAKYSGVDIQFTSNVVGSLQVSRTPDGLQPLFITKTYM